MSAVLALVEPQRQPRRLRNVTSVAEMLGGVSVSLVRKLEKNGALTGFRVGTGGRRQRLLFDEDDVRAYVESCRARGAGAAR